jgi:hypothetical protein
MTTLNANRCKALKGFRKEQILDLKTNMKERRCYLQCFEGIHQNFLKKILLKEMDIVKHGDRSSMIESNFKTTC